MIGRAFLLFIGLLVVTVATAVEATLLGPPQGLTPGHVCASQYALANYACSLIPYSPLPPPAPPQESSRHHRHHRHSNSSERRGHGQHRSRSGRGDEDEDSRGTPEEEDCCRWLFEMDNDCVCEMLVHLPDFLSRPVHQYSVVVGDTCNVTYSCGGRVIRK